jgi:anti-anti-sigma regulatory factor
VLGSANSVTDRRDPDDARFVVESEDDDLVLRVSGRLDRSSSTELLRRLRVLAEAAVGGRLVIDLAAVTNVSDAALDTLRRANQSCHGMGVPLVLRAPGEPFAELLADASPAFTVDPAGPRDPRR